MNEQQTDIEKVDLVTSNGEYISYAHIEDAKISLECLRTSLPNICRYNGAIPCHLLWHLALCVKIWETLHSKLYKYIPNDPKYIAACLALHDMHEVYVTDVVHGLKKYILDYVSIEKRFERHLFKTFGVPFPEASHDVHVVKIIDNIALLFEMEHFGHPGLSLACDRLCVAKELAYGQDSIIKDVRKKLVSEVLSMDADTAFSYILKAIDSYKESIKSPSVP